MSDGRKQAHLTSLRRYQRHVPGQMVLEPRGAVWDDLQLRSHLFDMVQEPAPAPAIPQHTLTFVYADDIEGARQVDGQGWTPFNLCAHGHVTIRPAGRSATLRWEAATPVRTLSLYLMPSRLEEVALQMGIAPSRVEMRDHVNKIDPTLKDIAERLREVAMGNRPADPLYMQTTLQTLAVRLVREYSTAPDPESDGAGGLSQSRFHRVQRYVHAHLDNDISLDDLAQEVGISKYHFSRRFKQRTGQSPYQFVIYERVRAARTQLRKTRLPLVEIALNVGFSSQSHFTRTFKENTGITPGRYRAIWNH